MNYTGYYFNGKPLASLSAGCMRFSNIQEAIDVLKECVDNDILYLDTSPGYCYKSEEENCETWVGEAIKGFRDKVILSSKCSSGNGGTGIGEYNPACGFSITTSDQVRREIEQSLTRFQVDTLDCYQLWSVHNPLIYDEALKPGGWLEGALKAKEEGLFNYLGITGHADNKEMKRWIDSGYFEMITLPFNIMDNSRMEIINYAREKNIAVIIMNPLAGGLLGGTSDKIVKEMSDLEASSVSEIALRYCASMDGVSALSGMTSVKQVRENIKSINNSKWTSEQAEKIRIRFTDLLGKAEHICTTCKYCMPCPNELDIPEILKLRNLHLIYGLTNVEDVFKERHTWWGNKYKVENCTACGTCESKCPNSLPISRLMNEVKGIFMGD
jgi:uncharacterized protein